VDLLEDRDELNLVVEHLRLETALGNKVHHPGEDLVRVLFTVADTADSQGNHLPQVVAINLGYGDIKAVAHPAGNRLHYLPLTLEGAVFRQTEANPADTDVHSVPRHW